MKEMELVSCAVTMLSMESQAAPMEPSRMMLYGRSGVFQDSFYVGFISFQLVYMVEYILHYIIYLL